MNLFRLSALLALLAAFGLAACGNKADLFMPPPPTEDELIEDQDSDEGFDQAEIGDGPAVEDASGVPLPTSTGAGPDLPVAPTVGGDEPDPHPPVPTGDE